MELAVEMKIGGATYKVSGFFRSSGKTIAEKMFGLMEKEVENRAVSSYNGGIPQNSSAVGNQRRI